MAKTKKKKILRQAKGKSKKVVHKVKAKVKVISKVKAGKFIGRITHYFSDIDVAVISLTSPLKVKDKIRVIGGQETDFEQKVISMQIDHKEVKIGKKGQEVGMKIAEKVHDGYKVYKI